KKYAESLKAKEVQLTAAGRKIQQPVKN
ncbi:hypothetical protein A2U01_0082164, partial [Trifolium medium]|nr:hypothetical protein [Trifolium medium]